MSDQNALHGNDGDGKRMDNGGNGDDSKNTEELVPPTAHELAAIQLTQLLNDKHSKIC
jgi:hypothetical protein